MLMPDAAVETRSRLAAIVESSEDVYKRQSATRSIYVMTDSVTAKKITQ